MHKKSFSYLIVCTVIAALGGFLFGFDTAVINGGIGQLCDEYKLNAFWKGFTVASALIGTIFGAYFIGRPSDKYGRRKVLFFVALFYLISAIGTMFPPNWVGFLFFRFLGGLGVGGASVVSPMYIAEISPAKYRGRLVAVTQFNIVLGILAAFFSNMIIAKLGLGDYWEWRSMFGVEAVPAFLFFVLLFLTPESPRWLIAQNRSEEAGKIFDRFGGDAENTAEEIRTIQESLALEKHALNEPFYCKANMKPILLVLAIASFNQFSGINAILYYATDIFKMAGAGKDSALLQGVVVGFINLIVTMISMSIIDHFGRRKLMIVGSIGYFVSLASIAGCFYYYGTNFSPLGSWIVLISIMVFISSHAFGQGAVIWVFISEIFPNRLRGRGIALGCFTHWFWNTIISCTFPVIAAKSGANAFSFFAVMMLLQLFWALKIMPETKGIPLEKIQKNLGIE